MSQSHRRLRRTRPRRTLRRVTEPTSEASDTTEDTPTSDPDASGDLAADFSSYLSPESGVSVRHPSDWFIEGFFGRITIASREELIDDTMSLQDEAIVIVVAKEASEFSSNGSPDETEPTVMLITVMAEFETGEEMTLIEGPTTTQINGQGAAGGPVAILVEPDDDLDVSLDIRRASEPDLVLVEVDNDFSGELESLIFLPDPGESYVRSASQEHQLLHTDNSQRQLHHNRCFHWHMSLTAPAPSG